MKRWLLKIAVLLVLGAIVNVAVAWGVPPLVIGATWQYGWPMYFMGNVHHDVQLWIDWPNFAINTAFYAAILCLLFAASFALQRRSTAACVPPARIRLVRVSCAQSAVSV